jgi:NADPH2:quinone reductase
VEYVFDHTAPDYRQELLGVNCGRGPDIILEMLADANLSHDLQMVAQRGRIAVIGSRGEITINPRDMMRKESVVLGIMLGSARPDELERIHAYLGQGLAGGALRPVIAAELPLAAAATAHEKVMQHGSSGKIVLIPD